MKIDEFLEKMCLFQRIFLEFLENEEDKEEIFSNLIQTLTNEKLSEKPEEFKTFINILSNVANNHYRTTNFTPKIEQILKFFQDDIPKYFSNNEIFDLFLENKVILLFLIKNNLIFVDKMISSKIISYRYKTAKYSRFFYREINPFIKNKSIEIPENFEENRQNGENEDEICEIIRKDLIENFINFIEGKNYPLTSQITHSQYESNLFLIEQKEVTLIEYAAFFGSVEIFKYLQSNGVQLNSRLWLFAVHGNSLEIIHILEQNKVEPPSSSFDICIKEAIKCYHNEIAIYIQSKNKSKSKNKKNSENFDDSVNNCSDLDLIQFLNFEFIKAVYDVKKLFFKLVEFNLVDLMKVYSESFDFDFNEMMDGETLLTKAVQNDQLKMTRFILARPEIDVNQIVVIKNGNKWMKKAALHIAIERENRDIVALLLSHKDTNVEMKSIESNDEKEIEKEKADQMTKEKVKFISKKEMSQYWNDGVETCINRKEKTPLFIAIQKKNKSIVKLLLKHENVYINEYSFFYEYYSFKAIYEGDEESLVTKTKSSKTALDLAIKNGSIEIIQILLADKDIDINFESTINKYIQYYYKKEVVNDIEVLNSKGTTTRTPLFYAVEKKNYDIVELLLKQPEIDVNYQSRIYDIDELMNTICDRFGYKEYIYETAKDEKLIKNSDQEPLSLAFEQGNDKIIDLLLNNPNIELDLDYFLPIVVHKGKIKTIQVLLDKGLIGINDVVIQDQTLLHYAIQEGEKEIVKFLLNNPKIEINKANSKGDTPLFLAIEYELADIVEILLKHPKIDVNLHRNSKSPLHFAIENRYDEITYLLLKSQEIDVNRRTSNGESPLYLAVNNEDIALVKTLLKNPDIDVNIQTNSGEAALHLAIEKENEEIVNLLLRNPEINVNINTNAEKLPLQIAFSNKNDNIIDLLLKRPEIDTNIILEDLNTPLNRSIEEENIGRIKILLSNDNTDVNKLGGDGRSALKLAVLSNNTTIFELLMKQPDIVFDIYTIIGDNMTTDQAKMLFIAFREKNLFMSNFLIIE